MDDDTVENRRCAHLNYMGPPMILAEIETTIERAKRLREILPPADTAGDSDIDFLIEYQLPSLADGLRAFENSRVNLYDGLNGWLAYWSPLFISISCGFGLGRSAYKALPKNSKLRNQA